MAGPEEKASGQKSREDRERACREWEAKLEDRVAFHLAQTRGQSLTLEFPVTDTVSTVRHYRFIDELAPIIRSNNCRELDRLQRILLRRCQECNYPVSSDDAKSFEITGRGAVCSLCHDMYTAVNFNPKLRNMKYFKQLHEEWKKKQDDKGERGGWRDKAGM
jgi:hypothetical protein